MNEKPGMRLSDFEPLLGSEFRLVAVTDHPGQTMKLLQVRDLSSRFPAPPGFRDPFSLLFVASSEVALAQSQYQLESLDGATYSLFLVPVGIHDDGGRLYEAMFA